MSNSNDLTKPIGEMNKYQTKATQQYCPRTYDAAITAIANDRATTTESIGFGDYKAQVVGIVLESSEADPNSLTIMGYRVTTSENFVPSSVPYGYIVNIPSLKQCLADPPSPNSPEYKSFLTSLVQAGFLCVVRPAQSMNPAYIKDWVRVSFTNHGPPHSGGEYRGNISRGIMFLDGVIKPVVSPSAANNTGQTWTSPSSESETSNMSIEQNMSVVE